MQLFFFRGLGVFCFQESAKKFEENVSLFGSTVESLLYRYGKVTFDYVCIWKTAVGFSKSNISNSNSSNVGRFLTTAEICTYLTISI